MPKAKKGGQQKPSLDQYHHIRNVLCQAIYAVEDLCLTFGDKGEALIEHVYDAVWDLDTLQYGKNFTNGETAKRLRKDLMLWDKKRVEQKSQEMLN